MLPRAHTGLTPPAIAGPGCNEGLGVTARLGGNDKHPMRLQEAKRVHKIRAQTAFVCDWFEKPQMKPAKKARCDRPFLTMELGSGIAQEEHCVLSARCQDCRDKHVAQDVLRNDRAEPSRRNDSRYGDGVFEVTNDDAVARG